MSIGSDLPSRISTKKKCRPAEVHARIQKVRSGEAWPFPTLRASSNDTCLDAAFYCPPPFLGPKQSLQQLRFKRRWRLGKVELVDCVKNMGQQISW